MGCGASTPLVAAQSGGSDRITPAPAAGSPSDGAPAAARVRPRPAIEDKYVVDWHGAVGNGHYAKVYRGEARADGAPVAVKVVDRAGCRPERLLAEVGILRLAAAAAAADAARDPLHDGGGGGGADGFVPLLDVYAAPHGTVAFLVFPYATGGDLLEAVAGAARHGRRPYAEPAAAAIVGQVASTLAFLHAHGIVHRDVKPENLLLWPPHPHPHFPWPGAGKRRGSTSAASAAAVATTAAAEHAAAPAIVDDTAIRLGHPRQQPQPHEQAACAGATLAHHYSAPALTRRAVRAAGSAAAAAAEAATTAPAVSTAEEDGVGSDDSGRAVPPPQLLPQSPLSPSPDDTGTPVTTPGPLSPSDALPTSPPLPSPAAFPSSHRRPASAPTQPLPSSSQSESGAAVAHPSQPEPPPQHEQLQHTGEVAGAAPTPHQRPRRHSLGELSHTLAAAFAAAAAHAAATARHWQAAHRRAPVVRLCDFGLARYLGVPAVAEASAAAAGDGGAPPPPPLMTTPVGTLAYSAPEIHRLRLAALGGSSSSGGAAPTATANAGYTAAVDVWSLGVVAYAVLCGAHPFDPEGTASDTALTEAVLAGGVSFAGPHWAHVSPEARALVAAMLDADPARRPTAAAVAAHPWVLRNIGGGRAALAAAAATAPGARFPGSPVDSSPHPSVASTSAASSSTSGGGGGSGSMFLHAGGGSSTTESLPAGAPPLSPPRRQGGGGGAGAGGPVPSRASCAWGDDWEALADGGAGGGGRVSAVSVHAP